MRPNKVFYIKGWADDAAAVLATARVCLAPLPFGAGLKGKFIDAMQTGTPAVTTAIGAEGMMLEGQWCGLVAESAAELAVAAVQFISERSPVAAKTATGLSNLTT